MRGTLSLQVTRELLLAQGKAEHSIVAYFQANNVAKDLASYRGLVLAYLSTRKYKEALCTAKEAVATLPRNAKAIALVGRVLATSPEGADKARRAFQKALQLDASCADAALALADLHAQRGECDAAAELLTRALSENEQDVLHAKLGDVYVIAGEERYPEALASYHAALSLKSGVGRGSDRIGSPGEAHGRRRPGFERRARLLRRRRRRRAGHGQLGARRRGGRARERGAPLVRKHTGDRHSSNGG